MNIGLHPSHQHDRQISPPTEERLAAQTITTGRLRLAEERAALATGSILRPSSLDGSTSTWTIPASIMTTLAFFGRPATKSVFDWWSGSPLGPKGIIARWAWTEHRELCKVIRDLWDQIVEDGSVQTETRSSLMSNLRRWLGTCAAGGIDESTSPQSRREAELARHEVEVNSSPHYEAQGPPRPHPF